MSADNAVRSSLSKRSNGTVVEPVVGEETGNHADYEEIDRLIELGINAGDVKKFAPLSVKSFQRSSCLLHPYKEGVRD